MKLHASKSSLSGEGTAAAIKFTRGNPRCSEESQRRKLKLKELVHRCRSITRDTISGSWRARVGVKSRRDLERSSLLASSVDRAVELVPHWTGKIDEKSRARYCNNY